jgi:hypothetical protein
MRLERTRVLIGLLGLISTISLGATRYAKESPTGSGNCSSWTNACDLNRAMDGDGAGDSGAQPGDQIWVKAGTYGAITLRNSVKVIGGFGETESLASQSNPASNLTVIDPGGGTAVISESSGPTTMLRGFTIKNGSSSTTNGGGGAQLTGSSAKFVQCIFENNQATMFGAAVSIDASEGPEFINCIFRNNGTGTDKNNVQPLAGGAVFLRSGSPKFTNCLFYNNKAGEGSVLASTAGTALFVNCTIANNHALVGYGGAIFDQDANVTIKNSILWGNTSITGGDQVFNFPDKVSQITYSSIQGGWAGTGNLSTDPLFVSSTDFRLQTNTPCDNVGSNAAIPTDVADLDWDGNIQENLPIDLAGNARQNVVVDLGAYEVAFTGGGGVE